MTVWSLLAVSDEFTQYVATNRQDVWDEVFQTNGQPITWSSRPQLTRFADKRRKKPKPVGDISFVTVGSIILNQKAYDATHAFLAQFGEFLEAECDGDIVYFFNVTNIISCVDPAKSRCIGSTVLTPAFHADLEPKDPQVFKDPLFLGSAIYVSDPAKVILEQLIRDAKLTKVQFAPPYDGVLVPAKRDNAA